MNSLNVARFAWPSDGQTVSLLPGMTVRAKASVFPPYKLLLLNSQSSIEEDDLYISPYIQPVEGPWPLDGMDRGLPVQTTRLLLLLGMALGESRVTVRV